MSVYLREGGGKQGLLCLMLDKQRCASLLEFLSWNGGLALWHRCVNSRTNSTMMEVPLDFFLCVCVVDVGVLVCLFLFLSVGIVSRACYGRDCLFDRTEEQSITEDKRTRLA